MSERLSSGHPRLDGLLGGGLPANAINVLIGLPGAGKTILAQQYVFANATPERPALYLSTVSEPLEKIIRYGQSLDFFSAQAVGRAVFYEDLGAILNERGLEAVSERIGELISERKPGLIVIDSFKALSAYADASDFRRFLHELAGRLSAFPTNCFWVGEYDEDAIADAPEFAVADTIISLSTARIGDRETRTLRVLKLRGGSASSGAHAYRITSNGIDVFPRLADPVELDDYVLSDIRISSGIAALDELLADGLLARRLDPLRRPFRGAERPSWACISSSTAHATEIRDVIATPAGEPGAARADRPRFRLDARRARDRAHVPLAGRRLHRRVGLRPARHGGTRRCPARADRQPLGPAVRGPGPDRASASTCTRSASASHARASACS